MPKVGMEPLRRKQITMAVLGLVADGGLEAVTLDKVAELAGVSKGVVAYYFHNKEELITETYRGFLDYFNTSISRNIHHEMKAREILEFIGDSIFLTLDNNNGFTESMVSRDAMTRVFVHFYSLTILNPAMRSIYLEYYNEYLRKTAEVVEMGIAAGEFREIDPRKFAYGYMVLLDGLLLMKVIGFQPSDVSVTDIYRDYIQNSLLRVEEI